MCVGRVLKAGGQPVLGCDPRLSGIRQPPLEHTRHSHQTGPLHSGPGSTPTVGKESRPSTDTRHRGLYFSHLGSQGSHREHFLSLLTSVVTSEIGTSVHAKEALLEPGVETSVGRRAHHTHFPVPPGVSAMGTRPLGSRRYRKAGRCWWGWLDAWGGGYMDDE